MTLTLYPAIDLKDGNCVRLQRGEMDQATVFGTDPGAQAAAWQAAGFGWVHVVDLNGAFAGKTENREAVESILKSVSVPVQLGGGLRDMAGIAAWLAAGISRVILGSAAAKNPALVREAAKAFPGRVAVGIDAKGGMVATEGWAETSDLPATQLAQRFEDAGIAAIIYTDIARDGMKTGLNLAETIALAKAVSVPVIASGGVASVADIIALKAAAAQQPNLNGSILGRALYDGSLSPKEALAAC
ncbi:MULTISPECIES: 1-(5-phosphoribosyl)-5-[(5-phosphoribosylamino)methylideneamino]imidazole-4-carboxamide isomerase [unclassified Acidocella]|uniref:1-(5-phosphoribosyl)-5-[(5- phosphoribosylamino)methylideneamino]imidazole-4- carboxamide isomerase n=1 Tax=unclassified Acidocella TaxID=2648610 RepID=UPI00028D55B0|nr:MULTISPECIES: 1-(5-phosphoribosyl)-5-[(5-phosphoribosylamino)methylideneamino]imidazole-4-carboxamide isomerase [unclassified Acidocella]EKN00598.1 bifunctional acetyltransferase/histidine biosynthesis HisA [Acidocella sp. MX-AZ02]WBO60135.1 1-(5-phosphoribosyl)-5-[(5-phosphoribosylamino)methylideneamino]imidazole-4-carboxamide isomerase [Acidocella sp. MX-AZ03]